MAPRATPLLSAALLLGGAGAGVASFFMPWRSGPGLPSFDSLPGAMGPGFAARVYGMTEVKGLNTRSWYDTMQSMCVRAAKVEVDQGIADTGACEEGNARYAEECNPHFYEQIVLRCEAYSLIYTFNKGLFMLACLTVLVNTFMAAVMVIPSGMFVKMRHFVLPGSVMVATYMAIGALVWCYISDYQFKLIGKRAQFPYPSLSLGFFVYVASSICSICGGMAAWPEYSGSAPKASESLAAQEGGDAASASGED